MKKLSIKLIIGCITATLLAGMALIIPANSGNDSFDFNSFKNPEPFYRPGYFWSWNDTMTKDLIVRQLSDMASHGAMTVCPLPIPSAFRPVNMPTSMVPDYMTPEYLELCRFVTEKCREFNMVSYFYDEGGWPSGSCLGKVVAQNPSLVRQALTRQVLKPEKGGIAKIPPDCLAAFLYKGDIRIRRLSPGTDETISDDSTRVVVFSVTKSGSYPDLLNPESTREFLRLTHEEYRKYLAPYFGSTLKIAFTDEPKVPNPGWTNDLAVDFRRKYGYDIINELPSVFEGESERDKIVRIDYFDWWSRRFADAYFGQIQEWCHRNNLLSGGHLDGEDATVNARTAGYGHPLRALRKMDVPAVDVIWRQLWPGADNHHFPKFASTVAHQAGTPWAFTESFAVYGNGLTASQMKWISDYQYVRGINLLVLGGYPLSQDDWLQAGCRPNFGPEDPVWNYMDIYHDYIGRLSYLMSLGKPDIKTALYYPVKDIWAGGSDLKAVCSSNDEVARQLLEHQCDFDFIDDDILESGSAKIKDGHLSVGPMNYEAICISRNSHMPQKSLQKLEEFIKKGGKVVWIDDCGGGKRPQGTITASLSDLPSNLHPTVNIPGGNRQVRVCKRVTADGSIYFITNEDTCDNVFTVEFKEDLPVIQLDPETGTCRVPLKARRKKESWIIPVDLKFAGSAVFMFTEKALPVEPGLSETVEILLSLDDGWSGRKITEYTIESHRRVIKDNSSGQPVGTELGDWRLVIGEGFSGDVEYQVNFNCSEDILKSAGMLDLGDVRYFCEVILNGQNLGRRIWEPFAFMIKGKLKKGENNLVVKVTNTLANQYVSTRALDIWTKNQLGPYHSRALAFEKESLPSGLFGPVTIR